ncbi:MAG: hypothetical protein WCF16_00330 [Alphaproteobacteria bacterium]
MKDDETEARTEARRRAAPFRMLLAIQVADMLIGVFLLLFSDRFNVPGEIYGLPVIKFVGLALIVIGAAGYLLFARLARRAAQGRLP